MFNFFCVLLVKDDREKIPDVTLLEIYVVFLLANGNETQNFI